MFQNLCLYLNFPYLIQFYLYSVFSIVSFV